MRRLVLTFIPHRYRDAPRAALFAVMSRLYAGTQVQCPVCGNSSRRWVSLGFPNRLCPNCSAFERQRLLTLYLENELRIGQATLRVIHFAPERCLLRYFSRLPGIVYIGADIDPPVGAVRLDITNIEVDTNSVDVVICSHVLEHVQADAEAVKEMRRVLRPGGTALIMGPVEYDRPVTYEDPSISGAKARLAAFGQSDHVRIYGADFSHRLRAGGFHVEANRYAQRLPEDAIMRYGLDPNEIIYVCT